MGVPGTTVLFMGNTKLNFDESFDASVNLLAIFPVFNLPKFLKFLKI